MQILNLEYSLRDYAWGSTTELTRLLGIPNPESRPQAELWWGAHESAPSPIRGGDSPETLADRIADDPVSTLGKQVADRFAGELPFLLKILSAERPLSLQAHPDAAQARLGFARENQAGLPVSASNRSYRDPRPKPELLCALSPFEALLGFRPPGEIHASLMSLEIDELGGPLAALASCADRAPAEALERFFGGLLGLDVGVGARIAGAAADRCRSRLGDPAHRWVTELATEHPDDVWVLAPLILNHLCLDPGEAIFLPAGELHSYLRGTGVELMANSDNVLRGGLTQKFIDAPELLRVLTWSSAPPRLVRPEGVEGGEVIYRTPAPEFALSRIELSLARPMLRLEARSAEIVLCVAGELRLLPEAGGDATGLRPGAAAFVPGSLGPYRVEGEGAAFRASVPVD